MKAAEKKRAAPEWEIPRAKSKPMHTRRREEPKSKWGTKQAYTSQQLTRKKVKSGRLPDGRQEARKKTSK